MICVLKDSVLQKHAVHTLVNSKPSSKSWFVKTREICLQYGLPHPLVLLRSTKTKDQIKRMAKKSIVNFWEIKFRADAGQLPSLEYFHPEYMSLTQPHPIWTSAGANPYQVKMSTIQAVMLSGRYRTELLCSKWSPTNLGFCQAPSCQDLPAFEDLHHILAVCRSLEPTRQRLINFTLRVPDQHPDVQIIVRKYCVPSHPQFVQFLLDCSVLPEVVLARQQYGAAILTCLFRITRTWCYCLHKARLKLLNRWKKF